MSSSTPPGVNRMRNALLIISSQREAPVASAASVPAKEKRSALTAGSVRTTTRLHPSRGVLSTKASLCESADHTKCDRT